MLELVACTTITFREYYLVKGELIGGSEGGREGRKWGNIFRNIEDFQETHLENKKIIYMKFHGNPTVGSWLKVWENILGSADGNDVHFSGGSGTNLKNVFNNSKKHNRVIMRRSHWYVESGLSTEEKNFGGFPSSGNQKFPVTVMSRLLKRLNVNGP